MSSQIVRRRNRDRREHVDWKTKMGLDAVEIVMEVEESFEITIPEDRAVNVRTVGDLYAIVLDLTKDITRDHSVCVTAATFHLLRRHLIPHVTDAQSIRPSWRIADTLPLRGRQRLWARLGHELDLRMPPLQRPYWMTLTSILLTATAAWFCYATFAADNASGLGAFLGLLTIVFVGLVLAAVTKPFQLFPAKTYTDYRRPVTQIVALNYAKISEQHNSWNATDIWNVLQVIIVEQLGVKKEAVTPTANFVYDLGMN
ncbi:acyl carrier protein [Novipirellula artificiosorum]|uniref:Acyl carrier protein n=1 Tax=Novipirellula artificiosorum TaxID=2528016 RepID=A0A5C6D740_9BACT|nr:hypothetical protein [Novipirellula artificiosorum]TWU32630.1 acyl carrier protein [Novipirellula artificiosorum]